YISGTYTNIDGPGGLTSANGINNAGQIVGSRGRSSFLLTDGTYTDISVPSAGVTGANGINDAGQIVGAYAGNPHVGPAHGFLLAGRDFNFIDVPGSFATALSGINN